MKTTLLIISLMINSTFPVLMAAENSKVNISTSQDVFNSKWNFSPLIIRTDGQSKVSTKIFKRLMWIQSTPIPVVETTFVYLENPQKDEDPKKNELSYIANAMKKSFGKSMMVNVSGNSLTVSGKFEKINRYISVNLIKKDNSVTIITSFTRLGLYSKLESEVKELHSILSKYDGKIPEPKKTSWYDWFSIVDEVHAQSTGIPANLAALMAAGNSTNPAGASSLGIPTSITLDTGSIDKSISSLDTSMNGFNSTIADTNSQLNNISGVWAITNTNIGTFNTQLGDANAQIGNANTNWNSTNVQIGNANTNWNNTNAQIGEANANWSDTNKKLDKANDQLTEANANWNKTNDELVKANATAKEASEQVNTNWAESNKLLSQALDPNHMAKIAFYSAAGAALGGVAVNLALQGVSAGISMLFELFTGAKKKKMQWEDFEKAMQAWDTQLNDLVKMEQIVDSYLAAFNYFDGKSLGNDYIKQLNISMRDMRFDRDLFMEKFKDQNLDVACRKLYYDAADELDQKVKQYDKILQFATTNNMAVTEGPNYFCSQLKELQRKILGAETQMQDLRLKILVAEKQYYGKQSSAIDKRDKDIGIVNGSYSDVMEKRKDYDGKVMERIKDAQQSTRSDWLSSCMNGKSEEGKQVKEKIGKEFLFFSYFKKKFLCGAAFLAVEDQLKKRDEASVRAMTLEDSLRKDLIIKPNNNVEMNLSGEQMNWMSKIHVDAYCYQFAHEDQSKIPAKCKEFPELLYSMSLSKGYEKAKSAYKNKCEERYINGLQQLATAP